MQARNLESVKSNWTGLFLVAVCYCLQDTTVLENRHWQSSQRPGTTDQTQWQRGQWSKTIHLLPATPRCVHSFYDILCAQIFHCNVAYSRYFTIASGIPKLVFCQMISLLLYHKWFSESFVLFCSIHAEIFMRKWNKIYLLTCPVLWWISQHAYGNTFHSFMQCL